MAELKYFEDLAVGDRYVSRSHRITAEEVARFAALTGDFNPLHLDEDYARETPFGRPIAHGLLGLSFVAGLASVTPLVDAIALLGVYDWQFLRPIYWGDEVHVQSEIVELEPNGRKRGRMVADRVLVNQHGCEVQRGRFEILIGRRTVAEASAERDIAAREEIPVVSQQPAAT